MTDSDSKPKSSSRNLLGTLILYVFLPLAIVVGSLGIWAIHTYNFLCWNGTDIDHYPSGEKMLESNYRGGLLHGTQIKYYPDGFMMYEKNYERGKLHGLMRTWDVDGKIAEETPFARGKRHGVAVCYDVSGLVSSEDTYVHGTRTKTTQYIRFPEQGHTEVFEGYYKNGKPDSGQFVRYSAVKDGFLVYTYDQGKLVPATASQTQDAE